MGSSLRYAGGLDGDIVRYYGFFHRVEGTLLVTVFLDFGVVGPFARIYRVYGYHVVVYHSFIRLRFGRITGVGLFTVRARPQFGFYRRYPWFLDEFLRKGSISVVKTDGDGCEFQGATIGRINCLLCYSRPIRCHDPVDFQAGVRLVC